jgi:hypothetical protein
MLLFFLVAALLAGQEWEYRIEEDGRFVQMLRWQEQESALYYTVEIDRQAGENWEEAVRGETETAFFEVSLAPGTYRYRVQVYDFLGRPAETADWIQFNVLLAKQPELSRFSPEAFIWTRMFFGC